MRKRTTSEVSFDRIQQELVETFDHFLDKIGDLVLTDDVSYVTSVELEEEVESQIESKLKERFELFEEGYEEYLQELKTEIAYLRALLHPKPKKSIWQQTVQYVKHQYNLLKPYYGGTK